MNSGNKKKVKVLKDEPAHVPQRPAGPGTLGYIAKRGSAGLGNARDKIKGPKCGQCEEKGAHVVSACSCSCASLTGLCR